jgi:hypothetical protein
MQCTRLVCLTWVIILHADGQRQARHAQYYTQTASAGPDQCVSRSVDSDPCKRGRREVA